MPPPAGEPDGAFNEEYCKWCYTDGTFKYTSKEQLIDFCVAHMASEAGRQASPRPHGGRGAEPEALEKVKR